MAIFHLRPHERHPLNKPRGLKKVPAKTNAAGAVTLTPRKRGEPLLYLSHGFTGCQPYLLERKGEAVNNSTLKPLRPAYIKMPGWDFRLRRPTEIKSVPPAVAGGADKG
jgi:hypothetical protein